MSLLLRVEKVRSDSTGKAELVARRDLECPLRLPVRCGREDGDERQDDHEGHPSVIATDEGAAHGTGMPHRSFCEWGIGDAVAPASRSCSPATLTLYRAGPSSLVVRRRTKRILPDTPGRTKARSDNAR